MDIFSNCERCFLIVAVFCGLLLAVLMPPLMGADEPAHFARIYSLTQGRVSSIVVDNQAGNYVPEALKQFEDFWHPMVVDSTIKTNFSQIKKSMEIAASGANTEFINQCYQTLYSPLAYLPQSAGVLAAKIFTGSVYWLLLSAKLFLLAFYIAAGYFAIKITPVFKWVFLLVLLMPTSLSLGASVSADGVVIALCALFFAFVFRYAFDESSKMDKKAVVLFSLFTIALALIKQSFLISLFVFFIPAHKFGSLKSYLSKLALILLPGAISAVLWSMYCRGWFVPLNGSNPFEQAGFILAHPFTYLLTILKTVKFCFVMWIYMAIGVLGWNNVFLFPPVYVLYIIAFILNLVFKTSAERASTSLFQKCVLGGLFLINFLFIATELYLSWTPPYFTKLIMFIQGRYLIPVLIPLLALLGFIFVSSRDRSRKIDIVTLGIIAVTYLNTFLSVFVLYYF